MGENIGVIEPGGTVESSDEPDMDGAAEVERGELAEPNASTGRLVGGT
jgi:hypothetical protein